MTSSRHPEVAALARSPLAFKPLPSDDPKQHQPDISPARRKLGWEPKVDLRDGLQRTIDYFTSILQ
jgi:UDP-glucuronate decarboxylase